MGGPCWLVLPPGGQARRTKAPPCTDNFQVAKFEHKGSTWHSVEQCYQAMKFEDGSKMRKKLQALEPSLRENDSAFGKSIIWHQPLIQRIYFENGNLGRVPKKC